MKLILALTLAVLVTVAACSPAPDQQTTIVMTVAAADGQRLPAQVAADAQSTLNAIQISERATAEAVAQQTAAAAQATGQAAAQATQVAQATYGAATATSGAATVVAEALQVTMTVQAMQVAAQVAQATATAGPAIATATAAAQATIAAQEAANIALLQADTRAKMAQENARYERVTLLMQLAAVAVILAALTFAAALVIRLINLRGQTAIRLDTQAAHLTYDLMGRPRIFEPARQAIGPGRPLALPALTEGTPAALLPEGRPTRALPAMPRGNVLIVGPTRTGKSTALRAVVKSREGQVVVIDPHYRPGAWGAAAAIVGSREYDEVTRFLMWLGGELNDRRQSRAQNVVGFDPLTVVLDELPNLADEIDPEALTAWRRVARQGSKYGLFVVIGSQSTRVKTMGIQGEGDVLENFRYALYLGKAASDKDKAQAALGNRAALLLDAGQPLPVKIPYDPTEDPDSPHYRGHNRGHGYQAHAPWNGGRPMGQDAPPAYGANGGNGNGYEAAGDDPSQVIILPDRMAPMERPPHDYGLVTDWGFISPTQVEEILALNAAGWSGRATQAAVFDYEGGAAHYMTKAVIDAYDGRPLPSQARLQAARARAQNRDEQAAAMWVGANATATGD